MVDRAISGDGTALRASFAIWRDRLVAIVTVLLVVATVIHLIFPILTLGSLAERNFNEGWNVYHALRAAQGEVMYDANPWRVNNYPFVSFYLIAWLDWFVGDLLFTGRLVAILSLAVTAVSGGVVVRCLGGRALEAVVTAFAIPAFFHLTAAAWTGADDPQTLGHAFMMVGLAVYVADRRSFKHLGAAALLFALGGFTKHNLVPIPLAVSLDILIMSRRYFAVWCVFSFGALAIMVVATEVLAGGDFLGHLLTARVYLWDHIGYHTRKFLIAFKLPMLVALVLLFRPLPPGQGVLLRAYGVIAWTSALYFAGGDGTSFNIFLDCAIFLAIMSGLAIGQVRQWKPGRWPAALAVLIVPVLAFYPVFSRLPGPVEQLIHFSRTMDGVRLFNTFFSESRQYLAGKSGLAVCENLMVCWRAGKPFVLDTFNERQQVLAGGLDEEPFLKRIRAREFSVIQTSAPIESETPGELNENLTRMNRFTDNFLRTVLENYRLDTNAPSGLYIFYVPR